MTLGPVKPGETDAPSQMVGARGHSDFGDGLRARVAQEPSRRVRLPSGFTHFIVVWRLHGRWVQVMDPAAGRTWMTTTRFLEQVYVHSQPVPVAGYREW